MQVSKMFVAAALTVALSGAALAQERGQEQSRDRRSPAAESQPRRPARDLGASQAQEIGNQDGLNDGSNDRATGHSYRPTEDSNYRHANRGWNSGTIDRDSYSQSYRQAYMQGYQRGYGRSW